MSPATRVDPRGTMILIGGSEDKQGARLILSEVARRVGDGTLVIATLASEEPQAQWERYQRLFQELGVARVAHLGIANREEVIHPGRASLLAEASAVFFTGGDQVRIATTLGGTALFAQLRDLYENGALLAGTSAGASAMGETMLVSQPMALDAHKVAGAFSMTRGLGLIPDLVIDQHFAQRARIERLIGAIAENPGVLGMGIDEDTGVIIGPDAQCSVIGTGAVYIADGRGVSYTNVSEQSSGHTLCLFDVTLHVLNHGSAFDLKARRPFRRDKAR
jgi:cyanophycinase